MREAVRLTRRWGHGDRATQALAVAPWQLLGLQG
jgi:hypothetical protein